MRRLTVFVSILLLPLPLLAQKKPGFLDRLNKKIEDINRIKNNPAQIPTSVPQTRQPQYPPTPTANQERTPANTQDPNRRYNPRTGSCALTWQKPGPVVERQSIPLSTEIYGREPDPLEPEVAKTIAEFGQTRTIRVLFPLKKAVNLVYIRNSVTGSTVEKIEPDSDTEPFEVEFGFVGNALFHASCEEGKYIDHGPSRSGSDNNIYFEREGGIRLMDSAANGVENKLIPFTCADCYFVNQVFRSGVELDQFVIMVSPSALQGIHYYVIRVSPFPNLLGGSPVKDLCKSSGFANCFQDPTLPLKLRREHGPNQHFPGVTANYWLIECASSCSHVSFKQIVKSVVVDRGIQSRQ